MKRFAFGSSSRKWSAIASFAGIALAGSGCVNRHVIKMDEVFPPAKSAELHGPAVAVMTVPEVQDNSPAAKPFRDDPYFLGKTFVQYIGLGPFPIIPLNYIQGTYKADIPRDGIPARAAVFALQSQGIPAGTFHGNRDKPFLGQPDDRFILSVGLRKAEIRNRKTSFFTVVIVSSFGEGRFFHNTYQASVALDCALWQGGQKTPLYSDMVNFSKSSQPPQAINNSEAGNENLLASAFTAAAGECIRKSGLVERRAEMLGKEYASLLARGNREEAAGRAGKALDLYAKAYGIAASFDKTLEAAGEMSRAAHAAEIPLPDEAKNLMARGRAAVRLAATPEDFSAAFDAMEQAVTVAPWWSKGHFNAGLAAASAGRWADAARHLRLYLALEPDAEDVESVRVKIAEIELHKERGDLPAGAAPAATAPAKAPGGDSW